MDSTASTATPVSRATRWLEPPITTASAGLGDAVRNGLGSKPKELASRFFYDATGSDLFEQICDLPEYYLTRDETKILELASGELARRLPAIRTLVELGSGSAVKTEFLIEAFTAKRSLRYAPIDVSRTALEDSVARLETRHPEIEIWATVAEYESGITALAAHDLGPKLILWLGSSIGNLRRPEAAAFLGRRRNEMIAEDRMLVGIDLRKNRNLLERAYDDSQGITARFNLNLLARINRELGGHFDLDRFAHRVHYDEDLGSVQSFIESLDDQVVAIDDLDLEVPFSSGERIHTEDSYKFSRDEIDELAASAGLHVEAQLLDPAQRFSLNLLAPKSP